MPNSNSEDPPSWGGAREGAGRRRVAAAKVSMTIQVSPTLKKSIIREAKSHGISMSRAAENRISRGGAILRKT